MFIARRDNHLFFAAGKVGTQTLLTVPGMIQMAPVENNISVDLNAKAASIFERTIVAENDLLATFVIRDPVQRMYSGLFEVVGKRVVGRMIRQMIWHKLPISTVNDTLNMLIGVDFWIDMLDSTLRLGTSEWIPGVSFDSHRMQYHCGNWLINVRNLLELAPNAVMITIQQLTAHLDQHSYVYSLANTSESFLDVFARTAGYESIVETIDNKQIVNAFQTAVTHMPWPWRDNIRNYLRPEINMYNELLSHSKMLT